MAPILIQKEEFRSYQKSEKHGILVNFVCFILIKRDEGVCTAGVKTFLKSWDRKGRISGERFVHKIAHAV